MIIFTSIEIQKLDNNMLNGYTIIISRMCIAFKNKTVLVFEQFIPSNAVGFTFVE